MFALSSLQSSFSASRSKASFGKVHASSSRYTAGAHSSGFRHSPVVQAATTTAQPSVQLNTAQNSQPRKIRAIEFAKTVKGGAINVRVNVKPVNADNALITIEVADANGEDTSNLAAHWAITKEGSDDWQVPPENITLPDGSVPFGDGIATRTPLPFSIVVPTNAVGDEDEIASLVAIVVKPGGGDEEWMHADDGVPFVAPLGAHMQGSTLIKKFARMERDGDMNNFKRYCTANETVGEIIAAADEDAGMAKGGAAALFTWIRMAETRALPLYEGHNYQTKDMVHVSEVLACKVALAATRSDETGRLFRLLMGNLPRGGGGGDDIRMGILNVMRDNGIKEGHRPGIECKFIQQWHQKLHSSTTPDDVAICEAYLHFLRGSGDWNDFWWHLNEYGNLTQEDLSKMKVGWKNQDGITGPGVHLPHVHDAFVWFRGVLRQTHSGIQLDRANEFAHWVMDEGLQQEINDLLANRNEWWVPGKIVELRSRLQHSWRGQEDGYAARDALHLDIALERHFRGMIEAMDVDAMSADDVADTLRLALESGALASSGEAMCLASGLWSRINAEKNWGDARWLSVAASGLDFVALALEEEMDSLARLVSPASVEIGRAGKADESYIVNFGEECVRGHPLFVCSRLIQALQRSVRQSAGIGPWTVVGAGVNGDGTATGVPVNQLLDTLQGPAATAAVQELAGGSPVVLISETLDGLEDIPPGVAAVLSKSGVDLLSHVALRARQSGALLATCSDDQYWDALVTSLTATPSPVRVTVDISTGTVDVSEGDAVAAATSSSSAKAAAGAVSLSPVDTSISSWAVAPAEYAPGVVGGKSSNLATLAQLASEISSMTGVDVRVPQSIAMPFGSLERTLAMPENADASSALDEALTALDAATDNDGTLSALANAQSAVLQLQMPDGLAAEVAASAQTAGLTSLASASSDDWWPAVRQVWASKWNLRAHSSRVALGVAEADLQMAVLLMEVVPSDYAFVLHSRNPVNTDDESVLGEVVVGLGETLVGNHPGSAMRFTAATPEQVIVAALPSKLEAMKMTESSVICRSDSNGEDLENFAGAGLYDSFMTNGVSTHTVNYANEPLLWDASFCTSLGGKLAGVAKTLETLLGAPQDIEGAVVGDVVYLLQARPQQL